MKIFISEFLQQGHPVILNFSSIMVQQPLSHPVFLFYFTYKFLLVFYIATSNISKLQPSKLQSISSPIYHSSFFYIPRYLGVTIFPFILITLFKSPIIPMAIINLTKTGMASNKPKYLKFQSAQQAEKYSQRTGNAIMIMENQVLDATSFAKHHPGGAKNITDAKNTDITAQIKAHFPLSEKLAESMVIGFIGKEKERILDYTEPLAKQIWRLDRETYNKVVEWPHWFFVPSPRLFESQFFERLSYSTWWHVAIFPAIIVSYIFYIQEDWSVFNPFHSLIFFAAGVFLFTFVEYCIHRFLFHAEWWLPDVKIIRMIHFFSHGIHHMLPNDPSRLVLPPPFAIILFLIGYPAVVHIPFPNPLLSAFFWSGYLIGYVVYDSTHYFLHFLDRKKHEGGYFHRLQKYHNQHHYGGEHAGFGVSSKFWDIVLRSDYKAQRVKKA